MLRHGRPAAAQAQPTVSMCSSRVVKWGVAAAALAAAAGGDGALGPGVREGSLPLPLAPGACGAAAAATPCAWAGHPSSARFLGMGSARPGDPQAGRLTADRQRRPESPGTRGRDDRVLHTADDMAIAAR